MTGPVFASSLLSCYPPPAHAPCCKHGRALTIPQTPWASDGTAVADLLCLGNPVLSLGPLQLPSIFLGSRYSGITGDRAGHTASAVALRGVDLDVLVVVHVQAVHCFGKACPYYHPLLLTCSGCSGEPHGWGGDTSEDQSPCLGPGESTGVTGNLLFSLHGLLSMPGLGASDFHLHVPSCLLE